MVVDVTDAQGKPVTFTPFYGALAHAIFFRGGSLDYFHSHICGSDPACAAGFGTPATTGHSTKPGRLELGVLLPATGRWRLFLQVTHRGKLHDGAVYAEGAMRRREHCRGTAAGTRARASSAAARWPTRPRRRRSRASSAARASR